MTAQQIRMESMRNQMLVNLDGLLDDISRLADTLPRDTADDKVGAMVMCHMAGVLFERRGNAILLEDVK